jgi:hypothetical protein
MLTIDVYISGVTTVITPPPTDFWQRAI